jgi:hypothetical protein
MIMITINEARKYAIERIPEYIIEQAILFLNSPEIVKFIREKYIHLNETLAFESEAKRQGILLAAMDIKLEEEIRKKGKEWEKLDVGDCSDVVFWYMFDNDEVFILYRL